MNAIKKNIPNTITCLNLLSGCMAITYTFVEGPSLWVAFFIALAAVFDLFDGMVARILKVSSPIGADLDSLADVISFGLAPAAYLFSVIFSSYSNFYIAFPVFLLAAFAAVRLAKFNNDERQHTSFIGLPVPANALFWIGFISLLERANLFSNMGLALILIYSFVVLMSYLMVSEVPMFSLKVKSVAFKGNESRYLLIIASAVLLIWLGVAGFAPAMILYILLSLFSKRG